MYAWVNSKSLFIYIYTYTHIYFYSWLNNDSLNITSYLNHYRILLLTTIPYYYPFHLIMHYITLSLHYQTVSQYYSTLLPHTLEHLPITHLAESTPTPTLLALAIPTSITTTIHSYYHQHYIAVWIH